jgi:predicted Zn finger-like uncharacterized protein
MDVQCERCKTEYEFDDALVSGKGTTVKCTNCGYQFKIRREGADDGASDRWSVQTQAGERLVFTSLRELQRAILNKQVEKSDVIARGDGAPRLISSIAELAPFFEDRKRMNSIPPPLNLPPPPPPPAQRPRSNPPPAPAPVVVAHNTPPSVARVPTKPPPPLPAGASVRPRQNTIPSAVPPPPNARGRFNTLRPGEATAVPPPPPRAPSVPDGVEARRAPTMQGLGVGRPSVSQPPPARASMPSGQPPPPPSIQPEMSSPLPAPTVPVRKPMSSYEESAISDAVRGERMSGDAVLVPSSGMGGRRRVGGWVVALVLLAGVAVIGWVWAKPYLGAPNKPTTSAQLDPRAKAFLEEGERALTDGNLDLAKENFDKASALAEKDPRVLLDLARFAAAQADVPWLKLRILASDATDEQKIAKQSLADTSARARRAAEDAIAVSPEDPAALRAKIDALRISNERDAARALVGRIIANATQAETAYVLAALDLAEDEPPTPTVISRLRVAAAGEGNGGRARAALVYALARAGDGNAARVELDKLAGSPRPHPLLPALRAFVEKAPAKVAGDAGAAIAALSTSGSGKPVDPRTLPPAGGNTGGAGVPHDGKQIVPQAEAAFRRGEYEKARSLYAQALDRNPADSEALSGLADVDRATGNYAGAKATYRRAISVNPSYLPALVGLADAEWDSGEKGAAVGHYREIVDRFPESAYPARVKQRTEGSAPPAPTPTTTATQTAAPTATTQPGDQGGF